MYFKRLLFLASIFLLPASGLLYADTLKVETDYRMRGVSYSNLDYDSKTASDTLHFYDQRLQLFIGGNFAPGVEIGAKISALEIVGATTDYVILPGLVSATTGYLFPKHLRTDFTPYIENAYVKILNIADSNLDLTVGKIPMEYADGLIISDNGTGFNAIKLAGAYKIPVPFFKIIIPLRGEVFTAKVSEAIHPDGDNDVFGGVAKIDLKDNSIFEFGYYEERDYSGSGYSQGTLNTATRSILKQFYDFKLGRYEKIMEYSFELAKQAGEIVKSDSRAVKLDGMAYKLAGKLIGEKTKLGKVEARAFMAVNSGDDNTASLDDTDESFSPTQTKRYDGFEQAGYGEMFGATPQGSFLPLPAVYSGINTLSLGVAFSPLYAWTFGVDYYLFSASQGFPGAPTASGFERIFGAEYSLGIEMDLSVKYAHSKNVGFRFSFDRYSPPTYEFFWPKKEPLARYQLEVNAKF